MPSTMRRICALGPTGSEFFKAGKVGDDVDFDAISLETQQALQADQAEAAQDACKWDSLEWK